MISPLKFNPSKSWTFTMTHSPRGSAPGLSIADRLPKFLFPRIGGTAAIALLIAILLVGLLIIPVLQVI
jgi:iron(III) transport system permease protein